jgi:hypothetical protein
MDYDFDSDFDQEANAEMSDDGTTAESDYELNSPDTDQIFETEQASTPDYDADVRRDVEGSVIMDAWDAKGTWYDQSYNIDDDSGEDPDETEPSAEDADDQDDSDDTEESLKDDDDLEDSDLDKLGIMPQKSKFTNDHNAHFVEPHNEHRRKHNQPESIGNILRRMFGLKKKKKAKRPEGYVPDEQLDWMQEEYEDELEEGPEDIEPDDDELLNSYLK